MVAPAMVTTTTTPAPEQAAAQAGAAPAADATNAPRPRVTVQRRTWAAASAFRSAYARLDAQAEEAWQEYHHISRLYGRVARRAREAGLSAYSGPWSLILGRELAAARARWYRLVAARTSIAEAAGWTPPGSADEWRRLADRYTFAARHEAVEL